MSNNDPRWQHRDSRPLSTCRADALREAANALDTRHDEYDRDGMIPPTADSVYLRRMADEKEQGNGRV